MTTEETAAKEKQDAAIKEVERIAGEKATAIFEAKKDDLLKAGLAGEDVRKLIKEIQIEAMKDFSFKGIDLSEATITEINGRVTAANKLIDDLQKQANEQMQKAATANGMMDKQINQVIATMKAQYESQASDIKKIYETKSGLVSLIPKAVSPITTASFGDRVIIGLREPGVDYPRLPERFVFDYVSTMTGGPGSNPLSWVEMSAPNGAPGWQANEGDEKASMNWTYTEQKVSGEMIAVWTPVSRQALLNWPMLEQEIRFELTRYLLNALDQAIISGTGTNEPFGILYYATAFGAGSLAATIVDANSTDVLRAAIGQVRKGAVTATPLIGGFQPNLIVVSQDRYTAMDLEKSSLNGTYLLPRFTNEDSTRIKGVQVIASNFIDDDVFIVGDFSRYLFNFIENLRIDVGYINAQFVQNLVTLRAEVYGMGRVKQHERPAFVTGEFSVAIAQLTLNPT